MSILRMKIIPIPPMIHLSLIHIFTAIEYVRTHNIPFFGICLGMQLAVVEYCRKMCIRDSTYIGSEHIILGLLKENSGVAAEVLSKLGVTEEAFTKCMEEKIGTGSRTSLSLDDFTPRSKRILQIAVMEASRLNHNYVGTEHLLIAVLEEGDSYGVRFLRMLGVRQNDIMEEIRNALSSGEQDDKDVYKRQSPD